MSATENSAGAFARHAPRAVIYSSSTAAAFWPVPGAIRFDALAAARGARVVSVSSVGHLNGDILWDDLNFERHPYDAWAAYSQSKTANVLFAVHAATLWADDGIRQTVRSASPLAR